MCSQARNQGREPGAPPLDAIPPQLKWRSQFARSDRTKLAFLLCVCWGWVRIVGLEGGLTVELEGKYPCMLLQLQPWKETICPPVVGVSRAMFARICRDLLSKQLLCARLSLQPRTSGPAVTNVETCMSMTGVQLLYLQHSGWKKKRKGKKIIKYTLSILLSSLGSY